MACTVVTTVWKAAGVLDATDLALVFCLLEVLLVTISCVPEDRNDQSCQDSRDDQDIFENAHVARA